MKPRWPLVLAAWLVTTRPVRADTVPDDAQRAASLFEQGRKEIAANRVDAACDAFSASLDLDPQLGTRLNLAACRAQQERWNDAYSTFADAAAEAERSGRAQRASYARDQMRVLDAKLVRLHVVITNPHGVSVTINGARIDPAKLYLARPGTITIDATAPNRNPFHVEKSANAGADVTIDVPSLTPVSEPERTATRPPPMDNVRDRVVPERIVERKLPRGPVPAIVAGMGGALLVTAGVMTLHARSRWQSATDQRDLAGVTSGQHEADAATVFSLVGAATLGVGIVLWMRGGATERVTVAPISNGVAIRGAF